MRKIEILENKEWKETGWESFEQLSEYPIAVQKEWSDNNYNYLLAEFLEEPELYRQEVKKSECKCECKSCRPEKTIFVHGQTQRQADEYIRTNVKAITDGSRLRGYSKGNAVLIILPQEKERVLAQAAARDFEIIEA